MKALMEKLYELIDLMGIDGTIGILDQSLKYYKELFEKIKQDEIKDDARVSDEELRDVFNS